MHPEVIAKKTDIDRLCDQYNVRSLELFGSAARNEFDSKTSDLDFLVEFHEMNPAAYADAYFGLMEALANLFQRSVDLVVVSAVRNPYFLRGIEGSRTPLYGA